MVCDSKTQIQKYYRLVKAYLSQLRLSRLKTVSKQKHKAMTIGYIAAIFSAFILSFVNHHDVNASITKSDTLNYMMLEHALNDDGIASVYPADSIENVKSLFDMVNKKFSRHIEKDIEVQRGDSLISIFTRIGFNSDDANDLYAIVRPYYKPSMLKAGQKATVAMLIDSENARFISMESFILPQSTTERLIIEKDENGKYTARKETDELVDEINSVTGTVNGALSISMRNAGVSGKIIANFSNIFSKVVNFRKDIHKGDTFKLIYEQQINPQGEVVRTGNILYAALKMKNNKIERYRFKDNNGNVDYYNEKGLAMQRSLLRKPLAFQAARISSPFGKRYHPILRQHRFHWGVDYAAPRGTPIYAAGEGIVESAKYNGGYGNYIKIRHNSEYSTAYGHISSFAKGIRSGVRVKQGQVIAYVGSTGRSTGNHLHFEIVQNGRRINPLTAKAAAGADLTGRNLQNFKNQIAHLKKTYKTFFASDKPTSNNKVAKN